MITNDLNDQNSFDVFQDPILLIKLIFLIKFFVQISAYNRYGTNIEVLQLAMRANMELSRYNCNKIKVFCCY